MLLGQKGRYLSSHPSLRASSSSLCCTFFFLNVAKRNYIKHSLSYSNGWKTVKVLPSYSSCGLIKDRSLPTALPYWCTSSRSLSSFNRLYSNQNKINEKNKSLGLYLLAAILGMLGLAYAFVPLYRLFCKVTGFGGTTMKIEKKDHRVDTSREITVHFTGQTSSQLPWSFEPLQDSLDVYPGETVLAFYRATNNSPEPLIGVAMYGVFPPQAGKYFEKIECFCFDEQRIGPHETVDMPVLFTLNPDLLKSKSMNGIFNITLNYTFFLATDQNIYWDEEKNEYRTIE